MLEKGLACVLEIAPVTLSGDKREGIVFLVLVILGGFIACLVIILVHGLMSDRDGCNSVLSNFHI